MDQNNLDTRDHGFPYLNSDRCPQAWAAIYDEVCATVEWIGDDRLRQTHALWSEINARPETGMLENIHGYCIRCTPTQEVFLIWVGPRKSREAEVRGQGKERQHK